jgi:hypothetical protein
VNISAPFIRGPIATSLLAAALLLAGIAAYTLAPGRAAAARRLPHHPGQRGAARGEPRDDGLVGGDAARAALRPHRRVTEITSTSTLGSTSITLQFDLDRDVDAAARDVQAAIAAAGGRAAAEPADSSRPTARSTRRRADPDPLADLGHAAAAAGLRRGQHDPRAEDLAGARRRAGHGRRRAAARGARAGRSRALAGVGLSRRTCATLSRRRRRTSQRAPSSASAEASTIAANDQLFDAEAYKTLVIAYQQRRTRRLARTSPTSSTTSRTTASPAGPTASAPSCLIRRQPGANIIETIERVKALLPSSRRRSRRRSRSRSQRPHADHPRLGERRRAHARPQRRSSS